MSETRSFILRKMVRYSLIFLVIVSINFLIPRLMPGDPVRNLLGPDAPFLSEDQRDAVLERYGLNESISSQYIRYIVSVLSFDLGYSIHRFSPVIDLISEHITVTLMIVLPALIASSVLSLVIGTWSGIHPGGFFDRISTATLLAIYCLPSFFLSLLFISIFSFELGLFPLGGLHTYGRSDLPDLLRHIALPTTVLVISGMSSKYLIMRNSVIQISQEHFIETMRSRGYSDEQITFRHVLRNAMPPYIAAVAPAFGFIFEGALVMEIVFSINGLGLLMYDSIFARDYPVIQGCFLIITISVLIANFVGDMLYGLADPRVRDEGGGRD